MECVPRPCSFFVLLEHYLTRRTSCRTDIRKPATQKAQIQRPITSGSGTNSGTPSDARSADLAQYTEPVSDDEDDEGNRHFATTSDEAGWADVDPQAAAEAKAFRDAQAKLEVGPAGQQDRSHLTAALPKAPFPKLTPQNLSKLVESRYTLDRDRGLNERSGSGSGGRAASSGGEGAAGAARGGAGGEPQGNGSGISLTPGRVEYVSSFRAQQGKKIAIPVRVEPKVFYANERTSASASLFPSRPRRSTDPFSLFLARSQRSPGSSSRSSSLRSASASSPSRTRTVRLFSRRPSSSPSSLLVLSANSRPPARQTTSRSPPRPSSRPSRSSRSCTRRACTPGVCA